jgi:hypothetical protein
MAQPSQIIKAFEWSIPTRMWPDFRLRLLKTPRSGRLYDPARCTQHLDTYIFGEKHIAGVARGYPGLSLCASTSRSRLRSSGSLKRRVVTKPCSESWYRPRRELIPVHNSVSVLFLYMYDDSGFHRPSVRLDAHEFGCSRSSPIYWNLTFGPFAKENGGATANI